MRPVEEMPWPQFIINGFLMFFWTFLILTLVTGIYYLGLYIKDKWL